MSLSLRRPLLLLLLSLVALAGGTAAHSAVALPDTITVADADSLRAASERLIPSEVVPEEVVEQATAGERRTFSPDPTAAVLWAIIPGGGQIYNRKYWKIPIVVGGMTALYYAISWNNNNLVEYANAYRDIKSEDPIKNDSWIAFVPGGADPESYRTNGSFQETLRHGRDFYRRNRDLSIIITVGVYALSIIDAYVDAELAHFDISPNLTLNAYPTYFPSTETTSAGPGVQVALSF